MLCAEVDLLHAILLPKHGGGIAQDLGAEVVGVAWLAAGFHGNDGELCGRHVVDDEVLG